jgi:hypothetical protein
LSKLRRLLQRVKAARANGRKLQPKQPPCPRFSMARIAGARLAKGLRAYDNDEEQTHFKLKGNL